MIGAVAERQAVVYTCYVDVAGSLSGGAVTEESDDDCCFDAVESDLLFQQEPIVADGSCVQGLTGLYNHGSTCYVNAAIQALSNWYVFIYCS